LVAAKFAVPSRPSIRHKIWQISATVIARARCSGLIITAAAALAVTLSGTSPRAQQQPTCELELVLALDVSTSVDDFEYKLQAVGLASALRNPAVVQAIRAAGQGGIFVTLVHWASYYQIRQMLPWTRLTDEASIRLFSAQVAKQRRAFDYGDTGLGSAIEYSANLIETNDIRCRRSSIDVSGDGRNTVGVAPNVARDRITARGITINGLAILQDEPDLERYYHDSLTGGPRAFVLSAISFDVFAATMLRKLLREIGGPTANRLKGRPARSPDVPIGLRRTAG